MDTPRGLKEEGADKALRDLFRSEGILPAPDGLEQRIMERIAMAPIAQPAKEKALIPRWTWILLAAVLVLPLFLPYQSTMKWPSITQWMPDLDPILRSPWLMATLVCTTALFGLEMWLSRRSAAVHH